MYKEEGQQKTKRRKPSLVFKKEKVSFRSKTLIIIRHTEDKRMLDKLDAKITAAEAVISRVTKSALSNLLRMNRNIQNAYNNYIHASYCFVHF